MILVHTDPVADQVLEPVGCVEGGKMDVGLAEAIFLLEALGGGHAQVLGVVQINFRLRTTSTTRVPFIL